jgi:hypothetical protein
MMTHIVEEPAAVPMPMPARAPIERPMEELLGLVDWLLLVGKISTPLLMEPEVVDEVDLEVLVDLILSLLVVK